MITNPPVQFHDGCCYQPTAAVPDGHIADQSGPEQHTDNMQKSIKTSLPTTAGSDLLLFELLHEIAAHTPLSLAFHGPLTFVVQDSTESLLKPVRPQHPKLLLPGGQRQHQRCFRVDGDAVYLPSCQGLRGHAPG